MTKNTKIFLILIFVLGFFLRFYKLGSFPPVFNRDEAAIGYNAYTILTAGKDEFGEKLPLTFKSFGDYKMPLYIYLTAPVIKAFGLNEFNIRFSSALFGSLTVLIIYLLVKEVTKKVATAIISTALLAIAPFHIHYSRLAFEANVALFLVIFGTSLFLVGLKKPIVLIFSSIIFILSFFCYFTPYFLVLPIISLLIILNLKEIKKLKDKTIFYLAILFLLIGFLTAVKTTILANKAKTNITIFKDRLIWEEMAKSRKEHEKNQKLLVKLYDNQYIFYGKKFLSNYLASFNPNFLFFEGGKHPWHKIPQIGNLYLIDLLFLLIGAYAILRKGSYKEYFFIFLFLLAPIPSAVTTDAPHTTRLLLFFVSFLILSAYGITSFLEKVNPKKIVTLIIILVYLYSLGFFLQAYFIHFPKNIDPLWLPGIKEKVIYAIRNKDKYLKIIINDSGESYIYFLFYEKYPLENYLKTVRLKEDNQGFIRVFTFDKYEFRKVNESDLKNKDLLIIFP